MVSWMGWSYELRPANIDETPREGELPDQYTLRLAKEKARESIAGAEPGVFVLAADTTVADEQGLLGKPADAQDAVAMLRRLRGRTHRVVTALAIVDPSSGRQLAEVCTAKVPMRTYSDLEIDLYVRSGDPLDKAGAYAIQHAGFHPVEHFRGCFACVMGLPLCHLERTLRSLGEKSPVDVPRTCQVNLDYDCPVFEQIMRGEEPD